MNIKQISLIIILFLSLVSNAQDKKLSKAQITVESQMAVQEASWNDGLIEDFMAFYWNNDNLEFIGSKGLTYGWQKTLDNYKKGYPTKEAMGKLHFTILENKQLSKKYIYIVGKWQLTKEKPAGGHFTLLWRKINHKWIIISDHTS